MTMAEQLRQLQVLAKATASVDQVDRLKVIARLQEVAQHLSDVALLAATETTSQTAVAKELGISQQAVSLRVDHALRRMADRLEHLEQAHGGGS